MQSTLLKQKADKFYILLLFLLPFGIAGQAQGLVHANVSSITEQCSQLPGEGL